MLQTKTKNLKKRPDSAKNGGKSGGGRRGGGVGRCSGEAFYRRPALPDGYDFTKMPDTSNRGRKAARL
jgi:hypothetical protein